MQSIETESIVLKTYDLADADKIVVLLTQEHGLVRGVAKGAKRMKSRFGSGLEPFSVVRLTYRQKDAVELVAIEKADLVRSHFASAGDPEFLGKFAYLCELLIAFTPPHDPNETLYRMVRACLDAASNSGGDLLGIGVYFELWLLRLAGYLPDWRQCNMCRRTFSIEENAQVNSNYFLICSRCSVRGASRSVDGRQREIVAAALKHPPAEFARSVEAETRRLSDISSIFQRLISTSIGREVVIAKRPPYAAATDI
jgi:DNA repair protein RecO (recombination protein O)